MDELESQDNNYYLVQLSYNYFSSWRLGVATPTHSQVGIVLCVAIVTFDLYSS